MNQRAASFWHPGPVIVLSPLRSSAQAVRELLNDYAEVAEKVVSRPTMFGDETPGLSPSDVLGNIVNAGTRAKERVSAARGLKQALQSAPVTPNNASAGREDESTHQARALLTSMARSAEEQLRPEFRRVAKQSNEERREYPGLPGFLSVSPLTAEERLPGTALAGPFVPDISLFSLFMVSFYPTTPEEKVTSNAGQAHFES